jgi:hypothetical protein
MDKRTVSVLFLVALLVLPVLVALVAVVRLTLIAAVGWPSSTVNPISQRAGQQRTVAVGGAGIGLFGFDVWPKVTSNSQLPEEGNTVAREMKTTGLHSLVVERLRLFDDFAMFIPETDRYVRSLVQQRAFQTRSQFDPDATRIERGLAVWSDK